MLDVLLQVNVQVYQKLNEVKDCCHRQHFCIIYLQRSKRETLDSKYLKKSTKMVAQKFACVTFILLVVSSCVNLLPQQSSGGEAPPALTAPSPGNSSGLHPVLTNVIIAPDNCPEGEKMAVDGVCREVFD